MGLIAALTAVMLSACGETSDVQVRADQRDLARQTLKDAPSQGFGPEVFATDDSRLGPALIAYAAAQHGLDHDPRAVDDNWGMRPEKYDAAAEFRRAQAAGTVPQWLSSLPPPARRYEALRRQYVRYQQIVQHGGWPQIPAGAPLQLGSRDARVAVLRQRLAAETQAPDAAPGAVFDAALVQALKTAQIRFGVAPSGMLDEPTRAALNVPAQQRLMQIKANLQRWRWAPRQLPPTRIEVNVPAGVAVYYAGGAPRMQMRVAVGKPGAETPMLTAKIRAIVLNPPWNVPDSIATRELLPKAERDPTYLERSGFVEQKSGDQVRLIQSPGPQNALGVVKFVFDNRYGVYLHDTPAKAAFTQARRSVSHGCVRVERAVDLAKTVLAAQGWSAERVDQAIAAGETSEVKLTAPLPVELFYWTAWADDKQAYFRNDIYEWDHAAASLADGVVEHPPKKAPPPPENAEAPPPNAMLAQSDDNDFVPAERFDDYARDSGDAWDDQPRAEQNEPGDEPSSAAPSAPPQ